MSTKRGLLALVVLALVASCGSGRSEPGEGSKPVKTGTTETVVIDSRSIKLHVPRSYNPASKVPLVVLLHGYTSNSAEAESYFKLTAESERRGFLCAMPDGTQDRRGKQYWNATEACCDFYGGGADDTGHLTRLVEKVKSGFSVDAKRVFFIGHSNGGFMSHRMACDHADVVTAIVSLAGMVTSKPEQCQPARGVTVVQIHGTMDETISYTGGYNGGQPYPSAAETVAFWRKQNSCGDAADASVNPLDLERELEGAETTVTRYRAGCRDGSRVELWSMKGAKHVPALSANFSPAIVDFLYSL
ncbi:MAG TPA: alpha/beta fold hydrolase [Candidatus Limnocylindrales bacterium]|nr:alpha/beta fold hydrolase [Candidatus Limnocylindrales bacterium]